MGSTANLLLVLVLVWMGAATGWVASSPQPDRTATQQEAATAQASSVVTDPLLFEAIAPAFRSEVMAATADRIARYTITATLHPPGSQMVSTSPGTAGASPAATPEARPDARGATPVTSTNQATITGIQELRFINDTGDRLSDLYLRLYPNLRQYDAGRMVIHDLTVDGVAVRPQPPPLYSVPAGTPVVTPSVEQADLILLQVPLPKPLAPGDTTSVRMDFTTTVPVEPPDGTGLFRYRPETGSWTLAHWFPILAGYDSVTGWEVDPPAAWSDPTFANAALFDVTLTAPADLVLVTTGVEVEQQMQGAHQVRRFVSGPVRDFVLVADPTPISASVEVNGTTVTSYFPPDDAAGGEQILAWAAQALAVFSELFGPYPYATLDLAAVPDVIGYEFPQLIFIGADYYADPITTGSRPGAVEFLVAHEIAHQWWYGLVGNNPHQHAFLDEGLAEYSVVLYFEHQYGKAAAQAHLDRGLTLRYASMLLTEGDHVVDQPTADFPDRQTYYTTVYEKGGLGFGAIRHTIGDTAFFTGLRQYAQTMRFRVATSEDLLAIFEETSGGDLDEVWDLWFQRASGRVVIVLEPDLATPVATPVGPHR
ncbi:MAG: M1 family metallopeptidase [Chloroflexota bacterium]|nr:M1 family metallopeptidase [Chloroflexota bacterium]